MRWFNNTNFKCSFCSYLSLTVNRLEYFCMITLSNYTNLIDCRYIFISDKVEIQDITKQTCMFVLVGPASNQVGIVKFNSEVTNTYIKSIFCIMLTLYDLLHEQIMERLNLVDLIGQPYGSHKHYSVTEFGQLYKILMPILIFREHLMSGLLLVG